MLVCQQRSQCIAGTAAAVARVPIPRAPWQHQRPVGYPIPQGVAAATAAQSGLAKELRNSSPSSPPKLSSPQTLASLHFTSLLHSSRHCYFPSGRLSALTFVLSIHRGRFCLLTTISSSPLTRVVICLGSQRIFSFGRSFARSFPLESRASSTASESSSEPEPRRGRSIWLLPTRASCCLPSPGA
jgi:hypothetical protein